MPPASDQNQTRFSGLTVGVNYQPSSSAVSTLNFEQQVVSYVVTGGLPGLFIGLAWDEHSA